MKKISISIPKPCHENWEAMAPEGKGKFCGSCQKTVTDFSGMSDRQLAHFFKKPTGSLCGRFMPDQLDRVIEMPQKRLPWVRYFFTIALPAFLVSCKFVGRQALKGEVQNTEQRITGDSIIVTPLAFTEATVGMMISIPVDSITKPIRRQQHDTISSIKKCKVQAIAKDSNAFSAAPFRYTPIVLQENVHSTSAVSDNLSEVVLGGLSISKVSVSRKKPYIPLLKQKTSLPLSSFSIYPNPVSRGSVLTLDLKSIEQGSYIISIVNSGGAVVQQSKIEVNKEAQKVQLNLNVLAAGTYFMVLANTKSGKRFTETLVVQ